MARNDKIALASLIVGILACIGTYIGVPEVRVLVASLINSVQTTSGPVHVEHQTALYAGPSSTGFDVMAQLPKGTSVMPLGVYGDFARVQAQVGGNSQMGFVLENSLSYAPLDLPQLDPYQVPWVTVRNYTANGPWAIESKGDEFADRILDRNIVPDGPFRFQVKMKGQGSLLVLGREADGATWWQGMTRAEIGLDSPTTIGMLLRDGTRLDQAFTGHYPKSADGVVVLESDQRGKHLVLRNSGGFVMGEVDVHGVGNFPDGLFPEGIKDVILECGPRLQMVVSELYMQAPPSGE